MAISKRHALKIAERRAEVLRLYRLGVRQSDIARQLGLSGSAGEMVVSRDLAAVRRDWKASACRDFDTEKGRLLNELDAVKKEAWAAWERSKQPSRRRKGEEREGNPRFLAVLIDTLDREAELMGLKPRAGELSTSVPVVAFRVHRPETNGNGNGEPLLDVVVAPAPSLPVPRTPGELYREAANPAVPALPPGADPAGWELVEEDTDAEEMAP
jgi:hypothetical protein